MQNVHDHLFDQHSIHWDKQHFIRHRNIHENIRPLFPEYGTSGAVIRYFAEWFNELRYAGLMPIRSRFLEKNAVFFGKGSEINRELRNGAAVMLHVYYDTGHYILLTGEDEKGIRAFDPYFQGNEVKREGVWKVDNQLFSHNIIISEAVLNDTGRGYYSMGETDTREALIINRDTGENIYVI